MRASTVAPADAAASAVDDGVAPLGLLASAISSRSVQVVPGAPGEPAWTDGSAIFVDPVADPRARLESLAVQASLLAAGSLDSDVVRRLVRRPRLARRYLTLEGHRALAAVEPLLPPIARRLIHPDVAAVTTGPVTSLVVARGGEPLPPAPDSFGTIRAQRLLVAARKAARAQASSARVGRKPQMLLELADDASAGETAQDDGITSPVGGGGLIGRWLSRLLTAARSLRGAGSPGGDAPTHWSRSPAAVGRKQAAISLDAQGRAQELAVDGPKPGLSYPEWDVHLGRYREDWCSVLETVATPKPDVEPAAMPDRNGLTRALARLGLGIDSVHRQSQGDDIDIDAVIEARVEALAGAAVDEALFIDTARRRRDLSVLLLLDVSGSAAEPAGGGRSVHEQQRSAAAALSLSLHELGDRVAVYAYRSQGRSAVQLMAVKRFDEGVAAPVLRRLHGLEAAGYSRLGAAIRHGSRVLRQDGGTPRRMLLVLSDGLAYDHGYEPLYGAADARRALDEARGQGIGCLCLSLGAATDAQALERVFGSSAHAVLSEPAQLRRVIGPLFRAAMRAADIRRKVA